MIFTDRQADDKKKRGYVGDLGFNLQYATPEDAPKAILNLWPGAKKREPD